MWNWIKNLLGAGAHVIDETIRQWVGDLISGVFGFIHTVFNLVGVAWGDMFGAARWLYTGIWHLGVETYWTFAHILRTVIPALARWANQFINDVWNYAKFVWHWTIHELDLLRHWTAAMFDATRRWVISDIWQPIWRTLAPAWRWITHEGITLWNLVIHPGLLVDWIWDHLLLKIEREAWNAGRLLGRFFLSLVIHNARTFLTLLEDILDAVL